MSNFGSKLIEIAGTHGPSQIPQQSVTPLPHVMAGSISPSSHHGGPSGFQMLGAQTSNTMSIATTTSMPQAAPVFGYSVNHRLYHSERTRQSKKAYATPNADNTINLIVQFGREVQAGGKTKLEIINVRDANNFLHLAVTSYR